VISVVAVLVVALAVIGGAFAATQRTSHVTRSHHVTKARSYSASMSSAGCPNMGTSTTWASVGLEPGRRLS
jgi:hypothetical protein